MPLASRPINRMVLRAIALTLLVVVSIRLSSGPNPQEILTPSYDDAHDGGTAWSLPQDVVIQLRPHEMQFCLARQPLAIDFGSDILARKVDKDQTIDGIGHNPGRIDYALDPYQSYATTTLNRIVASTPSPGRNLQVEDTISHTIDVYRCLASISPETYNVGLLSTLRSLAVFYFDMRMYDAAYDTILEAFVVRDKLLMRQDDEYIWDLFALNDTVHNFLTRPASGQSGRGTTFTPRL